MANDGARPSAARASLDPAAVVRRIERLCRRYLQLAVMLLAAGAFGWLHRITGQVTLDLAGSLLVLAFALQATAPLASWISRRMAQRRAGDLPTGLKPLVLVVWLLAALALMLPTLALLHDVIGAMVATVTRS